MTWKTLTSKAVFDNPWITVFDESVVNPGGGTSEYGRVHFKNKAVAILPLDEEGNTWLVGQDRYTLGTFCWELPMGGAPIEETPLEAAKRELKEETGLSAGRWTETMKLHTSNSITDEVGIVFLAEQLEEGASQLDQTENIVLKKLRLAEAIEMIDRGEITDAISVAALLNASRCFGG